MAISQSHIEGSEFLRVSPEFFDANKDARFWIGKVSVGNVVLRPECYNPLLKFRGDIYVNELGFLEESALDAHGRESDENDERSVLFAAVENQDGTAGRTIGERALEVVGSSRLIVKDKIGALLPIEYYFPEAFETKEAEPLESVEVSRYIARHPKHQHLLALSLVRAMTYHCVAVGHKDAYAMLEQPLLRLLNAVGIPLTQIAEPKQIKDLNGELYPIVIRPEEVFETLKTDIKGTMRLRDFFEQEGLTAGEGYYPEGLVQGQI